MIKKETEDGVTWITIDRSEKSNSLTLKDLEDLAGAVEETESGPIVITGVEDVFCAGGDLGMLASIETVEDAEEFADRLFSLYEAIEDYKNIVVGAVNGLCYGAGLEMVEACDLAVSVEDAVFALPETKIGIYAPYTVERLRQNAGKKRTNEIVLTGETIDAETALEWGFVNRVVEKGELKDEVLKLVESVSEGTERSIEVTKNFVNTQDRGERERAKNALVRLFLDEETQDRIEERT